MSNNLVFARHETFHPRFGWIKKGFDRAVAEPDIFIKPDAHIRLGVGKNMVRSIRYWTHALGVLKDGEPEGRAFPSVPTRLGRALLDTEAGLDPYLEELGTLWLLHWHLVRGGLNGVSEASAWAITFFSFVGRELRSQLLVEHFQEHLAREYPDYSVAASSLKKDANCILRMYGEIPRRRVSEESIQCPWAELGLLVPTERSRTYQFRIGPKPGLSDRVIGIACLDFLAEQESSANTVSVSDLLGMDRSPGLAFKLNESSLYSALERLCDGPYGLELRDTAGLIQLHLLTDGPTLRGRLLADEYGRDPLAEVAA